MDNKERLVQHSKDVFRMARSSPTCFLTGSAALLFFSHADEIYECIESLPTQPAAQSIAFAHRLRDSFSNTLRQVQVKDIDFAVYGGLAAVEREIGPALAYYTRPGYLVVEAENCANEYYEAVDDAPAGWYVRGSFGAQWALSIELVIIHNLVFHLFKPPRQPQLWCDKMEVQFRELANWMETDDLISSIARITRGYQKRRGWGAMFPERSDSNVTGEVFYYLIKLRGAKFLNEYLR